LPLSVQSLRQLSV